MEDPVCDFGVTAIERATEERTYSRFVSISRPPAPRPRLSPLSPSFQFKTLAKFSPDDFRLPDRCNIILAVSD